MNSFSDTSIKMKELEYALMTAECSGLAQLPTHLVRIDAVDDEQNAWFAIPRPSQESEAFGENISVQLDFYKKGKPFYLCAQGEAEIVSNLTEVPDTDEFQSLRTMLWKGGAAVKVKIENVAIFGEPAEEKQEGVKKIGGTLVSVYQWLFSPVMSA